MEPFAPTVAAAVAPFPSPVMVTVAARKRKRAVRPVRGWPEVVWNARNIRTGGTRAPTEQQRPEGESQCGHRDQRGACRRTDAYCLASHHCLLDVAVPVSCRRCPRRPDRSRGASGTAVSAAGNIPPFNSPDFSSPRLPQRDGSEIHRTCESAHPDKHRSAWVLSAPADRLGREPTRRACLATRPESHFS